MLKLPIITGFVILSLAACSSEEEPSASVSFGECAQQALKAALPQASGEGIAEAENIAAISCSGGKTHVHLPSVGRYCESNAEYRTSKSADTLKIEEYFDENNYSVSNCSCASSMDLILDHADEGIQVVLLYGDLSGRRQVFQAEYE